MTMQSQEQNKESLPEYILSAQNLTVTLKIGATMKITPVRNVSFDLFKKGALGIVGESGCGKTSLVKAMLKLYPIKEGSLLFEGADISKMPERQFRKVRKNIQSVFQDPIGSLSPRMSAHSILKEPLLIYGEKTNFDEKIDNALLEVGLPLTVKSARAHELSGGQAQRLNIARALICSPKVLIADEAVSALDVSVQAQVLNLLLSIQQRHDLSLIFVSHNIAAVSYLCPDLLVMYLGEVVEKGPTKEIINAPYHPYTKLLIDSLPKRDKNVTFSKEQTAFQIPSLAKIPSGCPFSNRCSYKQDICETLKPELREIENKRFVACHFPLSNDEAIPVEIR